MANETDDDDVDLGKNQNLRNRAQAGDNARNQRQSKPGIQALYARARRGRDMTDDADEESKKVGGYSKKMARMYEKD